MPLLSQKPELEPQYSKANPECAENLKLIESAPIDSDFDDTDDLLANLDMSPLEQSDESVLSAINELDDLSPAEEAAIELTNTKAAALAAAVRELARAHGPFDSWQIDQIVRTLKAPADGPVR